MGFRPHSDNALPVTTQALMLMVLAAQLSVLPGAACSSSNPPARAAHQDSPAGVADLSGRELVGKEVVDATGASFGSVIDVVRDSPRGGIGLVVKNPRILEVGLRYAPLPMDYFYTAGSVLRLRRDVSREEFQQRAHEFRLQPEAFEPVQDDEQLSRILQLNPPTG